MRKTIEMAFSMKPSRPRISSVPAKAPWNARKTLTQPPVQKVVVQTGKPVKA
jgi:hypothetical protein